MSLKNVSKTLLMAYDCYIIIQCLPIFGLLVLFMIKIMNELGCGDGCNYNKYGIPCFLLNNRDDCGENNSFKYKLIMLLPVVWIILLIRK